MGHDVRIRITAFTPQQADTKAKFLEALAQLDTDVLQILAEKIGEKGVDAYNKKIKANKRFL